MLVDALDAFPLGSRVLAVKDRTLVGHVTFMSDWHDSCFLHGHATARLGSALWLASGGFVQKVRTLEHVGT